MTSITSANAIITYAQPILFPAPVQIQGFATDDIYDTEQVRIAETQMGVDGFLSAGFVFNEVKQVVHLQADSDSNDFFDAVNLQQVAAQDIYPLDGIIILPGLGKKWIHTRGILTMWKPLPDGKKVLQQRTYEITWQRISPAPA